MKSNTLLSYLEMFGQNLSHVPDINKRIKAVKEGLGFSRWAGYMSFLQQFKSERVLESVKPVYEKIESVVESEKTLLFSEHVKHTLNAQSNNKIYKPVVRKISEILETAETEDQRSARLVESLSDWKNFSGVKPLYQFALNNRASVNEAVEPAVQTFSQKVQIHKNSLDPDGQVFEMQAVEHALNWNNFAGMGAMAKSISEQRNSFKTDAGRELVMEADAVFERNKYKTHLTIVKEQLNKQKSLGSTKAVQKLTEMINNGEQWIKENWQSELDSMRYLPSVFKIQETFSWIESTGREKWINESLQNVPEWERPFIDAINSINESMAPEVLKIVQTARSHGRRFNPAMAWKTILENHDKLTVEGVEDLKVEAERWEKDHPYSNILGATISNIKSSKQRPLYRKVIEALDKVWEEKDEKELKYNLRGILENYNWVPEVKQARNWLVKLQKPTKVEPKELGSPIGIVLEANIVAAPNGLFYRVTENQATVVPETSLSEKAKYKGRAAHSILTSLNQKDNSFWIWTNEGKKATIEWEGETPRLFWNSSVFEGKEINEWRKTKVNSLSAVQSRALNNIISFGNKISEKDFVFLDKAFLVGESADDYSVIWSKQNKPIVDDKVFESAHAGGKWIKEQWGFNPVGMFFSQLGEREKQEYAINESVKKLTDLEQFYSKQLFRVTEMVSENKTSDPDKALEVRANLKKGLAEIQTKKAVWEKARKMINEGVDLTGNESVKHAKINLNPGFDTVSEALNSAEEIVKYIPDTELPESSFEALQEEIKQVYENGWKLSKDDINIKVNKSLIK